jgi:hypothetical protein
MQFICCRTANSGEMPHRRSERIVSNRTSPRSHCAVVNAPRSKVTSNYPFFTFIPVTSYELLTLGHTASHFLAIDYVRKTICERFELMTQFPLRVGVAREMICPSQRTGICKTRRVR